MFPTPLFGPLFSAPRLRGPDALFHDPLAERLAGARGTLITDTLSGAGQNSWAWVMRTYLMDRIVEAQVRSGIDLVINLAAGLDARPYRMKLPPTLRWVEIDLPQVLAYKNEILSGETPVCALERIALDLSDTNSRREVFRRCAEGATRS